MTAQDVTVGVLAALCVVLFLRLVWLADEMDRLKRRPACKDCWLLADFRRASALVREQWNTIEELRGKR